jgi:hypothetical protein
MKSAREMRVQKKDWTSVILVTGLFLVLAGTLGPTSLAASNGKHTVVLEMGVAFDLPKGYAILQREIFEGAYATTIQFGYEFRPNHLKDGHLQIVFWPTAHDGTCGVLAYTPSQYVEGGI